MRALLLLLAAAVCHAQVVLIGSTNTSDCMCVLASTLEGPCTKTNETVFVYGVWGSDTATYVFADADTDGQTSSTSHFHLNVPACANVSAIEAWDCLGNPVNVTFNTTSGPQCNITAFPTLATFTTYLKINVDAELECDTSNITVRMPGAQIGGTGDGVCYAGLKAGFECTECGGVGLGFTCGTLMPTPLPPGGLEPTPEPSTVRRAYKTRSKCAQRTHARHNDGWRAACTHHMRHGTGAHALAHARAHVAGAHARAIARAQPGANARTVARANASAHARALAIADSSTNARAVVCADACVRRSGHCAELLRARRLRSHQHGHVNDWR